MWTHIALIGVFALSTLVCLVAGAGKARASTMMGRIEGKKKQASELRKDADSRFVLAGVFAIMAVATWLAGGA